ncbi:phage tail-collar fiber domain-containing protein [Vibrio cholerae]|uniref:phage tail-collar fiber domain-containing protein n=1 Tax=Vibrio cholerae TaxID=666 RepID=UPI00155FFF83|nr:phage tail protein [Vibrio cholerae]NOF88392.1 phage tail protein [Vibrio cholerae]NOF95249.1 phage tail protein [Vibrio cholerae]
MSQTAIPLQFEKYLQNQISVGKAPDMNEMIFAYIPNLDPSQPIDRNQGLPATSTWVHQQNIDQVGKLGDNALVYSVVIPGSVAAFTFNAIYLRDKNVPNSCGMVVHKATETKEAGMASTKSLMQQYTGAAQVAGITVDAQTWQIDYQARLLGIEDNMRLANLDNYGHTAFIQGFDVTQQADPAKYKVAPGVVYVGGLRAELKNEVIQTISAKPTGLYIDVVRTGTVLSKWQNIVTVRASATPLTDYVDQNQQQHYVARLAGINANGSITDWRVKTDNADQEWSPFINYSIGHEVVRNNLRYIARAASGPDNGGAVAPESDSGVTWNAVLPAAYSIKSSTINEWLKIAVIDGNNTSPGDFLWIDVVGGTERGDRDKFSAEIIVSERDDIIKTTVTPKTMAPSANPEFYTKRVSYSLYELWIRIATSFPTPVTIIRKSQSRNASTVSGILEDVSVQPTGLTLVPYDTGYQFASIPIGMEVAFDTPPPTNDPRFRFVKLTHNDAYNTGLLTSQTLSGSAPELVSTAVISAAQSPINGQAIYLKNTMGVYAVPAVTQGILAQNIPQPAGYRINTISQGVSLQTGPSISGFIITSAASESQITGGLKPRSFGEVLYKRIY